MTPTAQHRFDREKKTLDDFCQRQGLHRSEKRDQILEVFLNDEHHLTVADLFILMRERKFSVDVKTLQSAMDLMTAAGLARKITFEDGTERYEHALAHLHHDHLICRRCGKILEFTNPNIEKLQDEIAREHGFVIEDHVLSLYGVCKACTAKAAIPAIKPLTPAQREILTPVSKLKPGHVGVIREILGGEGMARRLAAMGIRQGKEITKVSAMLLGGPVVVSIDRRQLALGNGMAAKILVDVKTL